MREEDAKQIAKLEVYKILKDKRKEIEKQQANTVTITCKLCDCDFKYVSYRNRNRQFCDYCRDIKSKEASNKIALERKAFKNKGVKNGVVYTRSDK